MSKMQITFKNPEEIVAFVNTVSRYDFDMDLKKRSCSGRCKIIAWHYAPWT